jgi:hypothetical protein
MQDCKESKVKMYEPIWSLVFKCNSSERQFNSIHSHKNIAIKEMREKKRKYQTKTHDVTELGLKMPTSSGLLTFNN